MSHEQIVEMMKRCGWFENADGDIENGMIGVSYPSWIDAMVACVEIGSGV